MIKSETRSVDLSKWAPEIARVFERKEFKILSTEHLPRSGLTVIARSDHFKVRVFVGMMEVAVYISPKDSDQWSDLFAILVYLGKIPDDLATDGRPEPQVGLADLLLTNCEEIGALMNDPQRYENLLMFLRRRIDTVNAQLSNPPRSK